jgi:hypothetical protein
MTFELSSYALKIEDLNTNKSEQDRLAPLIEALATALGGVSSGTEIKNLFESKVVELLALCKKEYVLLAELEELRKDPENLR